MVFCKFFFYFIFSVRISSFLQSPNFKIFEKANNFLKFLFSTSKKSKGQTRFSPYTLFHSNLLTLGTCCQIRIQILVQFFSSRSLLFFSLRSTTLLSTRLTTRI